MVEFDPDQVNVPERELEAAFEADVGTELHLVDAASTLLVATLIAAGGGSAEVTLDAEGNPEAGEGGDALILLANIYVGVRAIRTIRAARAVLSRGYEGEARAHDRILVELLAHRRVILDDPTGGEALAWIRRERTSGVTKRVAAMGDRELYRNLSTEAHGDPEPAMRLLDHESNEIDMSPQRTPATRASLLLYAGFARDQAMLVSHLSGKSELKGIQDLDTAIAAAWDRLADKSTVTADGVEHARSQSSGDDNEVTTT